MTHLQARVHRLDGSGSPVVHSVVVVLVTGPERRKVGLVPNLEGPVRHFVDSEVLDEPGDDLVDEAVPVLPAGGWRDDALVGEDGLGPHPSQVPAA